jgi:hypothetical protein
MHFGNIRFQETVEIVDGKDWFQRHGSLPEMHTCFTDRQSARASRKKVLKHA